jgi:hypothetical protein
MSLPPSEFPISTSCSDWNSKGIGLWNKGHCGELVKDFFFPSYNTRGNASYVGRNYTLISYTGIFNIQSDLL